MSTSKEQLMRFAESALKQTAIYQRNCEMGMPDEENYKMSYLLVEGSINKPERVLAYAVNDQAVLLFHPMEKPVYESLVNDWEFNFDYDLFQYLEGGFNLIAMTPDAHTGVWYEIAEYHGTSGIACVQGMQKYLHYCKQHGITKERLARETGYDGMDVMTLYDRQVTKGSLGKTSQEPER